jgi:Uma2 family endonuclease
VALIIDTPAALLQSAEGGELVLPPDLRLDQVLPWLGGEYGWRCDVLGDRLIWMPPANPWSSALALAIMVRLAGAIAEQQLPIRSFGADAGFVIDPQPPPYGRFVSPDGALIAVARITPETAPRAGYWRLLPDLAIEVRSPSDRPHVWQAKLEVYAGLHGVRLWAVDVARRTVEVWRDGQLVQTLSRPDDELELEDSIPGWRITRRELWTLSGDPLR